MRLQRLIVTITFLGGLGLLQSACRDAPLVGTPCTPGSESAVTFGGFKVSENTIEVGAPECGGGVCLINHFQGMVSCPLGQPEPVDAQGQPGCIPEFDGQGNYMEAQGTCALGAICAQAGSRSPVCDPAKGQEADKFCQSAGAGARCGADGRCECQTNADCLFVSDAVVSCDTKTKQCLQYACHRPNYCQQAGAEPNVNAGKDCCLPGSDTPVVNAVCGQCTGSGQNSTRDAESAVYCTCRCGVAEGAPDEPDYDFCTCPDGFECSELRPNLGLGDPTLTGKFCIRAGTAYDANQDQCGAVDGYWTAGGGAKCAGVGTGQCQTSGGSCN